MGSLRWKESCPCNPERGLFAVWDNGVLSTCCDSAQAAQCNSQLSSYLTRTTFELDAILQWVELVHTRVRPTPKELTMAIKENEKPDRTVEFGTPEFTVLLDQLIAEHRQALIANSGETLISCNNQRVLVKCP